MNHAPFHKPKVLTPLVTVCLLALAMLTGCHAKRTSAGASLSSDKLDAPAGNYQPQTINSRPLSQYQFPYGKPNLHFNPEEKQISGFAGCNRYFGSYTITGDTLVFDHIASTKKACMEITFEQVYLEILSAKSYSWKTDDSILILTNSKNTIVFRKTEEEAPKY